MPSDPHLFTLERNWHPIGLEFMAGCRQLGMSPLVFQLYVYMLIRSSPNTRKRAKNGHIYGGEIVKGEFFENKDAVATFFGKQKLSKKGRINWFMTTVKPLIRLGLAKKIVSGKRGFNAAYIVYDIREVYANK